MRRAGLTRSGRDEFALRQAGWFDGIPIVADPTLHPGVIEITDPDSQEVLGGVVLAADGNYSTVGVDTLATLRRFPQCHVGGQRPAPWRIESPVYAEVVDALGLDPLALTGRTWLDPAVGFLFIDEGTHWVPLAP